MPSASGRLRHLAAIVESAHDAVIGESLDGLITSWNRGAEQLFGFSSEEAIGRSGPEILFPTELPDAMIGEVGRALDGNDARGFESPVTTRDDRKRFVHTKTVF